MDDLPPPAEDPEDPLDRLRKMALSPPLVYGSSGEEAPLQPDAAPDLLAAVREEMRKETMRQMWREREVAGDAQAARLGLDDSEAPGFGEAWLSKVGHTVARDTLAGADIGLRGLAAMSGMPAGLRGSILTESSEKAAAADEASRDRLAEATVAQNVYPKAAMGAFAGAEALGMLLNPAELLPGGAVAEGATTAFKGARRLTNFADLGEAAARGLSEGAASLGRKAAPAGREAAERVGRATPGLDSLDEFDNAMRGWGDEFNEPWVPEKLPPEEVARREAGAPKWLRHPKVRGALQRWARGEISDTAAAVEGLRATGIGGVDDAFVKEGHEFVVRPGLRPQDRLPGQHIDAVVEAFDDALGDLSRAKYGSSVDSIGDAAAYESASARRWDALQGVPADGALPGNDAEKVLEATKQLQRQLAAGAISEEEASRRLLLLSRAEARLTDPHLDELQRASLAIGEGGAADLSMGAQAAPGATLAMPVDLADQGRRVVDLPGGSFEPPETPFQFNPHKLDLPDEIKAAIPEVIERNVKAFRARGSGTVKPWERLRNTKELVRKMGITVEDLMSRPGARGMTDEELALVNTAAGGAGQRVGELTRKALAEPGNLDLKIARDAAMQEWTGLLALSAGGASEAGRALNAQKMLYAALGADEQTKLRLFNRYKSKLTPEAEHFLGSLDPNNQDELFTFLSMVERPDFWKLLHTYWISSILSGIGTQGRNIIGNTGMLATETALRPAEAAVEVGMAKLSGRTREVYFRESLPSMAAITEGLTRGVAGGIKALRYGGAEGGEKFMMMAKNPWMLKARYLEHTGSPFAKPVKAVATAIDIPFRGLGAMDVFFRSVATSMQAERLATRQALGEGLTGGALTKRVRDLVQVMPEDMAEAVAKHAKKMTFVDAVSPATEWFLKGREVPLVGPVVKVFAPFARIADRINARGFEMTPLGFIKVGRKIARGARAEGGTLRGALTPEVSELTARAGVGTMIMAGGIGYGLDGRITAWAPREQTANDAFHREHKKPWSLKIGDKWVPFAQMEPLSYPLALAAIAVQAAQDDKPIEDNRVVAGALGVGAFLGDKSWLEGFDQLNNLMSGSYRSSQGIATIYRTVGGLVWPSGLMRNVATLWDGGTLREPQDAWDHIVANIPGSKFRGSLPPRLDARGRPAVSQPQGPRGLFGGTPVAFTEEDMGDLIDREYRRLSVSRNYPGRRLSSGKLDDDTWREYHERSGALIDARLRALFAAPSYWSASDEGKKKTLKRIEREAREHVRVEMGISR